MGASFLANRTAPRRRIAGPLAAALLALAVVLAPAGAGRVAAAGPSPSPQLGDTRSSGEGAGAAGDPLGAVQAIVVVLVLGLAATGVTVLYVRLTRPAG